MIFLSSIELVRSLCVAYEVVGEEATQFVHELAENQRGISLAYLHHLDSLKSGNSYTNEQHIKLKDHVDVRRGEGREREGERKNFYLILHFCRSFCKI